MSCHLAEYLRHEGLTVWLEDEQLDIGDQVLQTLEQGLQCSRFIVVCLSKHFANSLWGPRRIFPPLPACVKPKPGVALCCRSLSATTKRWITPDFLYDKYCVDVRTNQGLERLLRKLGTGNPQKVSRTADRIPCLRTAGGDSHEIG